MVAFSSLSSPGMFKHKLDPTAVLRRASTIPGCKSVPVPNSPLICSFLVGLQDSSSQQQQSHSSNLPQRDPSQLARISVFTDTGTVSVGRILQGNLRQVFRRNVTSLDTIEELLRDPPQLTAIDESLISTSNSKSASSSMAMTAASFFSTSSRSSQLQQTQLELVQAGSAILKGEREKLQAHVSALEQYQRDLKAHKLNAAAAAVAGGARTPTGKDYSAATSSMEPPGASATTPSHPPSSTAAAAASPAVDASSNPSAGLSGMEFQFSLPPDAMKDVDRCLTDIHSMGKLVRKVATNGRGTVFLYGNGGVAYTPQIPKALYHRLSQLRHSSYEHRPAYVSLGSRDRYYCSFHDGSYAFKGPKGLDRELKKAKRQPVSVAFGSTYDTFAVVFADGSWKCGGRAVPPEFEERLGKRRDIQTVNLGPEGEWFLKLKPQLPQPTIQAPPSKKMWWGGIHSELEAAIEDLLHAGHQLHFLDFGEEGSYFVSYD